MVCIKLHLHKIIYNGYFNCYRRSDALSAQFYVLVFTKKKIIKLIISARTLYTSLIKTLRNKLNEKNFSKIGTNDYKKEPNRHNN